MVFERDGGLSKSKLITLCMLKDSSFWFDTIFTIVHCTYHDVSGYNYETNVCFSCLKILYT